MAEPILTQEAQKRSRCGEMGEEEGKRAKGGDQSAALGPFQGVLDTGCIF